MPTLQRTNYLAITIALALAGLVCVFAAFQIDARIRKAATSEAAEAAESARAEKEQRILEHVAAELGFDLPVSAEGPAPAEESKAANDTQVVIDATTELLKKVEFLDELPLEGDEAAKTRNDLRDNVLKLVSFWNSDTSIATYDGWIASGDFYLISSPTLRQKLTELKLAQERLRFFENLHTRFAEKELPPFLLVYGYLSPDEDYVKLLGKPEFNWLLRHLGFLAQQIQTQRARVKGIIATIEEIKEFKETNKKIEPAGDTPAEAVSTASTHADAFLLA